MTWSLARTLKLLIQGAAGTKPVRDYITWQDDFSVGVELIDEQHKVLLQVINTFLSSLDDNYERFAIGRSPDEIIKYTEYLFIPSNFCSKTS